MTTTTIDVIDDHRSFLEDHFISSQFIFAWLNALMEKHGSVNDFTGYNFTVNVAKGTCTFRASHCKIPARDIVFHGRFDGSNSFTQPLIHPGKMDAIYNIQFKYREPYSPVRNLKRGLQPKCYEQRVDL